MGSLGFVVNPDPVKWKKMKERTKIVQKVEIIILIPILLL